MKNKPDPFTTGPFTATAIVAGIADGSLSRRGVFDSFTRTIAEREPEVRALVEFDMDTARAAADASGDGALAGVPVGVKDVIATAGWPTRFGSPLYADERPGRDAAVVSLLKAHGAYVIAKTTTVEFASLGAVPPTVNPQRHEHTPGGSSSGSAAAVAAGMMPVALATQTGGSTIRPASFCGVAAIKPTYGTVPVDGLRPYAPSLDTIGWMARSIDDLSLVAEALSISLNDSARTSELRFGFYRTPYWSDTTEDCRAVLEHAKHALVAAGHRVDDIDDPTDCDRLNAAQDIVMHGEGRLSMLADWHLHGDALHREVVDEATNARGFDGATLRRAYDYLAERRPRFDEALADYDAWLTPAVPGEAPAGLARTGEATFNRLWTGLHMPCVTVPGLSGRTGLPIGVQLVARRFDDARLLRAAKVVESMLRAMPSVEHGQ